MSSHKPVCEIPGLLSLITVFRPRRLLKLENENELLASMDIDHPVCIQGKIQYK